MDKNRLGKGLSSLLGDKSKFSIISSNSGFDITNRVVELPLEEIDKNPNQPRKHFNQQELNELADSIAEYGVIQPILVHKKTDGRYQIIAGERRFLASKQIGLTTIPAIIKDDEDEDKYFIESLIENIQRADLNSIEEAEAYKLLIEKYSYTQEQLAKSVGKNRSTITNSLRLLTLPKQIQQYLIDGKLSMGQARALINCPLALEIAEYAIANESTVREVEQLVKQETIPTKTYSNETQKKAKKEINIDGFEEFKRVNGSKCKIAYSEKTKTYNLNMKFNDIKHLEKFINRNTQYDE